MRLATSPIARTFADKLARYRQLEEDGFAGAWLPSINDHDTMTLIAAAGAVTSRIELGVDVVPVYARHPLVMAQQALTAAAASGDRFILGLGLSHRRVIEGSLGLDFAKPVRYMREYLEVLRPLLRGEHVDFTGEVFRVDAQIRVPDAEPPPVIVAALGPQMLALAGRLADGTVTWMAGPTYLEGTVLPAITHAAEAAGRPQPRIIASVPVIVTADADAGRERIDHAYGFYTDLPSYRRVIEGSGAKSPADVSPIGDEAEVVRQLQRLRDLGVSDFIAIAEGVDRDARARTYDFLKSLTPEI